MKEDSQLSDSGPKVALPLAKRGDFSLGNAKIRPSLRMIEGPAGIVKGEPRVIQVLVALCDARGAVLSREDLLHLCWDGRLVGDDAINRAIAEVRRIASAAGAGFEVETVPRIGHRIVGIDWDEEEDAVETTTKRRTISRRTIIAGSTVAGAVLIGGGTAIFYQTRQAEIDDLIERGRVLQGSGVTDGPKQAEGLFREAIQRDSHRADAWGWLAVVLDDTNQAREAARRALDIDVREPNARTILALQRRDLDSWTDWEDRLLGVLEDAPDNALALSELTFFYQGMGRCKDSWRTNERAIRKEPFNPTHNHRRAIKHWIFGRLDEADKVANSSLQLWPRDAFVWNARMLIFAFTDRASAALALLKDEEMRPADLTAPSIESWRAALTAISTRSSADIAHALETCTRLAPLAPGLAANAIMAFSYLGEVDAAYRVAQGLLEGSGSIVQRTRGGGIRDVYSGADWGRTQFLFVPATEAFRAHARFPIFCKRLGHATYWRERGIWPDPFVRGALDPAKLS